MQETWKAVKGFEGLYQISNFGRVKSLVYKEKILKPITSKTDGYVRIGLHKNRTIYTRTIHRLVAEAFIENPMKKPHVNHIDGNKQNNHVRNLEWCTASENQFHSLEVGLRTRNHPDKSKPVDMFTKDGEFLKTFPSIAEAMRQTSVGSSNIYQCCAKKYGCKTAGGYIWRYHDELLTPEEKSLKESYVKEIYTEVCKCNDMALLDLIHRLLCKESGQLCAE